MPDALSREARTFPLAAREAAIIVAFWALFAMFRVADGVFTTPDVATATRLLVPAAAESLGWIACTPLLVGLVERCAAARRRVAVHAVLCTGAAFLAALGVSALGAWLRTSVLVSPGGGRRLNPPYWFWVGDAFAVALGVIGAAAARAYLLRYRNQREQHALLEARLAEARLDALRRQLDPHFLFNTLSLITSLVDRDPPGARRMIARLSDLLRASLEDATEPEIPLHQELALVDVYLDIMRVRFAGRLAVETHIDADVRDALLPALVLQPLVENAVRHGVEYARGPGRIRITAARDDRALVVRVWDGGLDPDGGPPGGPLGSPPSGPRADDSQRPRGHGVGLRNTVARLEQLYGAAARVQLRPDVEGGTEVEVRIPLRAGTGLAAARPERASAIHRPVDGHVA